MKLLKFSSILIFSLIFMWVCMPQLSAKHHHSHKYRSSSFSINFNVDRPRVYTPVYRPAYVERTTIVRPYAPVVQERVYYPYYQPIIVERPQPVLYVQPQFSYYSSWGY